MNRYLVMLLSGLLFMLGSAGVGLAEVKQIQMKIDGYLCGN